MTQPISRFKEQYAFLSNMAVLDKPIEYKGVQFKSVENFYQAMKYRDESLWLEQQTLTPYEAKKWGKMHGLRSDWNAIKKEVMWKALQEKFSQKRFQALLLATDQRELIEGNTWNDTYWGVCNGEGQNVLGKMLMQIRTKLQTNNPIDLKTMWVKDQAKASIADSYIGFGAIDSSTQKYKAYFDRVNVEKYEPWEIVFVSINGKRPNAIGIEAYKETLQLAAEQGVVFCADNPSNRNRDYNTGERALAKWFQSFGYTEHVCTNYSLWLPNQYLGKSPEHLFGA